MSAATIKFSIIILCALVLHTHAEEYRTAGAIEVVNISEYNFADEIAKGPILVAKLSRTCKYCTVLEKEMVNFGSLFDPPLRFGKIDCSGGCPSSSQIGFRLLTRMFGHYPELVLVMPSAKNNTFTEEGAYVSEAVDLPLTLERYYGPRIVDSYVVWASLHSGSHVIVSPLWWQIVLTIYHLVIWGIVTLLIFMDIKATGDGRPYKGSILKDGGTIALAAIILGVIILVTIIVGCCCHRCRKRKTD
eukprot:gnl/MRDRNA2_/MRDRNA2_37700_c0_seq1.p1 gnl/MRDRNA2_/MRDRNA2_37700_c0~~gnl/MRDRNA2_/MRDRNA2_37700_c0_seq1.p1  ORF type:complete len:246 (+),score=16.58 gnl/MRDRNA2_/MRDRNA2_37700_c0_seq1:53-790(+)